MPVLVGDFEPEPRLFVIDPAANRRTDLGLLAQADRRNQQRLLDLAESRQRAREWGELC